MAHEIRLAGPWEFTVTGGDTVRCQLPFDCEQHATHNGFTLQRRFHRPSGLESTDKLYIVITADQPLHNIRLNDHPVTAASTTQQQASPPTTFEITDHIQEFNLLEVPALAGEPLPGTIEAVMLRIETAS